MNFELEYQRLLSKVMNDGIEKEDRTGVGTRSMFGMNLRWDASKKHFPLMTGKEIRFKNVISEFKWILEGDTNIQSMLNDGCNIWLPWADDNGEVGPIYGYQLRNFNGEGYDQLRELIKNIRLDPNSRRHIISLWNPLQLDEMKLPPCYPYLQFYVTTDTIHLHVTQRSMDLFIGGPYDIALFSLLLIFIANETWLYPGKVDLTIVDAHVYNNHHEQIKEYLIAKTYPFPNIKFYDYNDIELYDYKHSKFIKTPIAI